MRLSLAVLCCMLYASPTEAGAGPDRPMPADDSDTSVVQHIANMTRDWNITRDDRDKNETRDRDDDDDRKTIVDRIANMTRDWNITRDDRDKNETRDRDDNDDRKIVVDHLGNTTRDWNITRNDTRDRDEADDKTVVHRPSNITRDEDENGTRSDDDNNLQERVKRQEDWNTARDRNETRDHDNDSNIDEPRVVNTTRDRDENKSTRDNDGDDDGKVDRVMNLTRGIDMGNNRTREIDDKDEKTTRDSKDIDKVDRIRNFTRDGNDYEKNETRDHDEDDDGKGERLMNTTRKPTDDREKNQTRDHNDKPAIDRRETDRPRDIDDRQDRERRNCTGRVSSWQAEEQEWCCENKKLGCRREPKFECDRDSAEQWSQEQRVYCCVTHKVGCVDGKLFDCSLGSNQHPWSEKQRVWCCDKESVGCPTQEELHLKEQEEVCQQREAEGTLAHNATLQNQCCRRFDVGCAGDLFDCFANNTDVAQWGDAQRVWCCRVKDVGCAVECGRSVKDNSCCLMKGVGCTDEYHALEARRDAEARADEAAAGTPRHTVRAKLEGTITDVLENPKLSLRRLRWALIAASDLLQQRPQDLLVTVIGGLLPNGTVPAGDHASEWNVAIPREWNEELLSEEAERIKTELAAILPNTDIDARAAVALGEGDSFDGIYFDADVAGHNADATLEQVKSTWEAAAQGTGILGEAGTGPQIRPLGSLETTVLPPTHVTTSTPGNGSSSKGWVWGLIGALGALCIGAGIAAVVVQRRRQQEEEMQMFHAQLCDERL